MVVAICRFTTTRGQSTADDIQLITDDGTKFTVVVPVSKTITDQLYVLFLFTANNDTNTARSVLAQRDASVAWWNATTTIVPRPVNVTCTVTYMVVPFSDTWAAVCLQSDGLYNVTWVDGLDTCSVLVGTGTWRDATPEATRASDAAANDNTPVHMYIAVSFLCFWVICKCISACARRTICTHMRILQNETDSRREGTKSDTTLSDTVESPSARDECKVQIDF